MDGLSRQILLATINGKNNDDLLYSKMEKNKILENYHITSGHGSVKNMKFLIGNKFHWSGIAKEIDKLVKECKT